MSFSASHIDISKFLPHRAPMLMVDKVLDYDAESVSTQFLIKKNNLFLQETVFSESGLIEHIAQSASAIIGQRFFEKDDLEGEGNQLVGYISAIKKIVIYKLPSQNDVIVTEAKLLSRVDAGALSMCKISAETFLKDQLLSKAEMTILIQEV